MWFEPSDANVEGPHQWVSMRSIFADPRKGFRMDQYERLVSAFVRLADTVVADYDAVELAQQFDELRVPVPIPLNDP